MRQETIEEYMRRTGRSVADIAADQRPDKSPESLYNLKRRVQVWVDSRYNRIIDLKVIKSVSRNNKQH